MLVLPALVLVVLALRNGGYDLVTTNLLGLVAWLAILGAVAFARPVRRSAWIAGGSIFAFMAWVGLSTLWSESAERSFAEFNQVSAYLAVFMGTVLAAQRLGIAKLADSLTLALAVIVGLALLSRLEPSLFPEQTLPQVVPDAKPRLSYPLNYWNGVALTVALSLPLFLHLATRQGLSRNWRAAGVALLPMSGLVLYLTFSRGGLVCAILAAAVFLAFTRERLQGALALAIGGAGALLLIVVTRSYRELNDGAIDTAVARSQGDKVLLLTLAVAAAVFVAARAAQRVRIPIALPRRRTRLILAGAAAVAVVLGLAVVASADLGSRLETLSSDSTAVQGSSVESRFLSRSGNGRTEYWNSAIDAWQAHPFAGIGAGTWSLWWQRRPTVANFVRDPHSLFFEVMSELGTVGVLLLLAMFGSILWAGGRAVRAEPRDAAAPALLAMVVAFTVNVAIDWTWELSAVGAVFFIAAGLIVSRAPSRREQEALAAEPGDATTAPSRGRRRPRLGRGMAVALVAWAAVFAQAVPLIAQWQVDRSQAAVRDGDLQAAENAAETARSVMPWAAGPNLQLAQTLEAAHEYEGAFKYAAEAVRQEPSNWQTWLVLARIESRRGNTAQARRYVLKSRSLNPGSTFWLRLGFQP